MSAKPGPHREECHVWLVPMWFFLVLTIADLKGWCFTNSCCHSVQTITRGKKRTQTVFLVALSPNRKVADWVVNNWSERDCIELFVHQIYKSGFPIIKVAAQNLPPCIWQSENKLIFHKLLLRCCKILRKSMPWVLWIERSRGHSTILASNVCCSLCLWAQCGIWWNLACAEFKYCICCNICMYIWYIWLYVGVLFICNIFEVVYRV